MTDMSPVAAFSLPPAIDWEGVASKINRWVGECLAIIKEAEAAISLALEALCAAGSGSVSYPLLSGQRASELAKELAHRANLAPASLALERMEKFAEFRAFRDMLCHGAMTIAISKNRGWVAMFENILSVGGNSERAVLNVYQDRADAVLQELKSTCHLLKSALGQVRASVAPR